VSTQEGIYPYTTLDATKCAQPIRFGGDMDFRESHGVEGTVGLSVEGAPCLDRFAIPSIVSENAVGFLRSHANLR
jgi:hypothetical protein